MLIQLGGLQSIQKMEEATQVLLLRIAKKLDK